MSAINSLGYNLAKFLIPTLEPLTHNEFTIKDSFSFGKEMAIYDMKVHCIWLVLILSLYSQTSH